MGRASFAVLVVVAGCIGRSGRGPAPSSRFASTAPSPGVPAALRPPASQQPATSPLPSPRPPSTGTAPVFLKGQTHVHTRGSYDARTPAEEVLEFYASHGYDFVAITDHNRITTADAPTGLLVIRGVELTQNSTVCEPPPSPGYRCLLHTTALFVDPALDDTGGKVVTLPFQRGRLDAYRSQAAFAKRMGAVAVLNHPSFHFAANAHLVSVLAGQGLRLVELFDASLDGQHPKGRDAAERSAERFWDEILTGGALVYAIASDDAHHFSDAAERRRKGKYAYVGDRGWIMVRARPDAASIREAMLAGSFYATTGVILDDLTRREDLVRLSVAAGSSDPPTVRFVGAGGRTLASVHGRSAQYVPRGDEGYVRAVVEAPSGEKAWLQPVTIERSARAPSVAGLTEVEARP